MRTFDVNDGFLYFIVAIVIVFVVIESAVFLVKAWKRGKELGLSAAIMKKTVISSAVFTIAPAVAILLGVIALSKALGLPLPWLRLSVIGSLTYETTAAATAASALGTTLSDKVTDPKIFAAICWVMTVGIVPGLILVPLFGQKIEGSLSKLKSKDEKWGDLFMTSLFLGMISAFLGVIFADISQGLVGWIPVFVMLAAAIVMAICGVIKIVFKAKWIEDYALPISMLSGMALSIPITQFVQSLV